MYLNVITIIVTQTRLKIERLRIWSCWRHVCIIKFIQHNVYILNFCVIVAKYLIPDCLPEVAYKAKKIKTCTLHLHIYLLHAYIIITCMSFILHHMQRISLLIFLQILILTVTRMTAGRKINNPYIYIYTYIYGLYVYI